MEEVKKEMEMTNEQKETTEKKEHRIYLTLPPTSPDGFKKMVQNLKENEVKFDSYNKAWYITPDMDFNKFKGFLGLPYEIVNERGKNLRAREAEKKNEREDKGTKEKGSVLDKLNQNKDTVEKEPSERKEPEHSREDAR